MFVLLIYQLQLSLGDRAGNLPLDATAQNQEIAKLHSAVKIYSELSVRLEVRVHGLYEVLWFFFSEFAAAPQVT